MAIATRSQKRQRVALQRKQRERDLARKALIRDLSREAGDFGQLLIEAWTRLGYRSSVSNTGESTPKKRTRRVKIAATRMTDELLLYKIMIRQRGFFGKWVDALPYRVRAIDLISDETCAELSLALDRKVSARREPEHGTWIVVERLSGAMGLPKTVTFKQAIGHIPIPTNPDARVPVGVAENRTMQFVDFEAMPHGLIAGAAGSGKSNTVNFIIAGLMRSMHPDDLQITLVDLKRMEFNHFIDAPHLHGQKIVFDIESALRLMSDAVGEIIQRADRLSARRCKSLSQWNEKYPDERIQRKIIVIDEFAELMLASGAKAAKAAETLVSRISNLGRAVGIHLLICTQRPAKQVLPMAVKSNMAFIIAGRTGDPYSSGVILGTGDAFRLPLHPGRMILQIGSRKMIMQTPYIEDRDIEESIRIARARQAGVIDGTLCADMVGIARWCIRNHDGVISRARLLKPLQALGLKQPDLFDFFKWCKESEIVECDGREYVARMDSTEFAFECISAPDVTVERVPLLMLPAPRPAAEPIAEKFDQVEQWLSERCTRVDGAKTGASDLYRDYAVWADEKGYNILKQREFGIDLTARGITKSRKGTGHIIYVGITLNEHPMKEGV